MDKKVSHKQDIFTEEEVRHISAFSETLKKIHIRLINEGYIIKDGLIVKPVVTSPISDKSDTVQL